MSDEVPLFDSEVDHLMQLMLHVEDDLSDGAMFRETRTPPEVSLVLMPHGRIYLNAGEDSTVVLTRRQFRVLLRAAHDMLKYIEKDCQCPCGKEHPAPSCCPFCNGSGTLGADCGIRGDHPPHLDRIDCPGCFDTYSKKCARCKGEHFIVGREGQLCPWRHVTSRHRHYQEH